MSMLQEVVPRQENYSQSRLGALHNVESTISELSGIFTHLATMVAQQGELAIRFACVACIFADWVGIVRFLWYLIYLACSFSGKEALQYLIAYLHLHSHLLSN
uniref:Syntaxin n=1 Tax=Rhizophora mucronata TaxID=61149 RepID=A0A2P2J848_RHIMU